MTTERTSTSFWRGDTWIMWVNNIGNDCRVTGGYWIPSDRPYETILEIVAPRACTHSPCGYQVAWPFRGCGGNWRKIRPPLPPNRFDFRSLISRPSFQYCRRTFAYCSLIFFSKKAVRGSIDLQRRLNLPVPVTGAAETPAEAAVIFPSRIQSTFDFLELKSGLLDIRLLEVNFQLRVGLQKVEKGMYNPNLRSQLG